MSPSWTPPLHDKPVQPENLTVILTNDDATKKKKDKKKKSDKKNRDELRKRKRTERTPPPSKEVFASGDNILVSVSFNKTGDDTSTREVLGVKRKRDSVEKKKKDKTRDKRKRGLSPKVRKKKNRTILNIKPVAIIDLDRSPFKEITPSPKDIIILSDSDNGEKVDDSLAQALQDQLVAMQNENQPDSTPQSPANYLSSTGPKTPPEPQIKFLLSSKQSQIRAITNPLHDPTEEQEAEDQQEENCITDVSHKGPNTPPEPPNSPPSSPDAYDPFEPTKSRSPTPEPESANQVDDEKQTDIEILRDLAELATGVDQNNQNTDLEKRSPNNLTNKISPEISRTSPGDAVANKESENKSDGTEKSNISPQERIGVVINQQIQQANVFPVVKPIISTSAFSSSSASIITSAPVLSNTSLSRANLFNTSSLNNSSRITQTSVPQRIILPTSSKSSPAKMSPAKPPIKSTPIKPMPASKTLISKLPIPNVKPITPIRKGQPVKPNRNQNGNDVVDVDLDFESPYSPGSSDYEDLFEPPVEATKNNNRSQAQKNTKSPAKNTFDVLFGSSPIFKSSKGGVKPKSSSASKAVKGNKKSTPQKRKYLF